MEVGGGGKDGGPDQGPGGGGCLVDTDLNTRTEGEEVVVLVP